MIIKVNIVPEVKEEEVVVNCKEKNSIVYRILKALKTVDSKMICQKEGEIQRIYICDILYIESIDRKTFLYTKSNVFEVNRRLYELENELQSRSFFRISKSIIVNLQRVQSLRPELGSRLLLTMDNGEKIMVSRQYARKIKEELEVI